MSEQSQDDLYDTVHVPDSADGELPDDITEVREADPADYDYSGDTERVGFVFQNDDGEWRRSWATFIKRPQPFAIAEAEEQADGAAMKGAKVVAEVIEDHAWDKNTVRRLKTGSQGFVEALFSAFEDTVELPDQAGGVDKGKLDEL